MRRDDDLLGLIPIRMIPIILWAGLVAPLSNADSSSQSLCPSRQMSKRSTYLPAVTCSGDHIKAALLAPAGCTPREKVVKIPWPNNTDVHQLTPTHVTVARCGGGCNQNRQICVPVKSRVKTVPVLLGRCGITAGKCDKECASVQVQEDLKCGCQCAVKKEHCNKLQHYREDLCSCQCLDLSRARNCHDSGRMWDPASCSCQCPIKLECSTGLIFDDNATCSCIPYVSDANTITEPRSERSYIFSSHLDLKRPEMITIIVLLSVIVIFIIVTIPLVLNNYTMKRKLRVALNPTPPNKKLYTSPRLAVDPDNTMHLLDSETEFSSERPTDSSLCSDSDTRTGSPPTHRTSIAPSDHSSLSRFTPASSHPNTGSSPPPSFGDCMSGSQSHGPQSLVSSSPPPPSFGDCMSGSQSHGPQSLVEGRPPIARKPLGLQLPRNEDEMSVCSSGMGQQYGMGHMDQNCQMGQYSDMGQMDQLGNNCEMAYQCQMGQHIPMNGSMGRMGHIGQSGPIYQSRQSQIVYPMVQNGSNPHMGQLGSNPQMVQRGAMYPLNNNGSIHEMDPNGPVLQVGRSGSLVRMGAKSPSSDCGPPLQINPNNCYVNY